MFEKWLESPQWLPVVSKPEVRMRVTSVWGQEYFPLAFACWAAQTYRPQAWIVYLCCWLRSISVGRSCASNSHVRLFQQRGSQLAKNRKLTSVIWNFHSMRGKSATKRLKVVANYIDKSLYLWKYLRCRASIIVMPNFSFDYDHISIYHERCTASHPVRSSGSSSSDHGWPQKP